MGLVRVAVGAALSVVLLAVGGVRAETIHKCRNAAGALSYSARPCPQDSMQQEQMDYVGSPTRPDAAPGRAAPSEQAHIPAAEDRLPARDAWPPREDMHEARARAAADEERAAAEKARQAEARKHSHECNQIRARVPMGYWESQGCM